MVAAAKASAARIKIFFTDVGPPEARRTLSRREDVSFYRRVKVR
jgi:hypothetical protein